MQVGLLGHGVVGSGVRRIIDGMSNNKTACLCIKRILVKDEIEMVEERMTRNIDDIILDRDIQLVVECMGGKEPAHTFVKRALENGKNVVTSNKKMLASYGNELFALAHQKGVKLLYEASVGGGIPWMAELRRIRRIDEIESFEGIFNGTTNYIISRMEAEGCEFHEMLAQAQSLGYAERDPSDDIDGYDVAYKTALTCLAAFDCFVDPQDIPVSGIRNITKKDMNYANEHGFSIKLLGKGRKKDGILQCSVMPCFVPKGGTFASVPLNYNAISSVSETLGRAVFTGQGAGSLPTAHAVVQDMLDIATGADIADHSITPCCVDESAEVTCYIRGGSIPFPYVAETVDEDTVITVPLSYAKLKELTDNTRGVMVIEVKK